MTLSLARRAFLLLPAGLPWLPVGATATVDFRTAGFARLEHHAAGRLGVFALDTGSRAGVAYREAERFPLCSTFKLIAVSAVLKRSETELGLLDKRLKWTDSDLVSWSPVTGLHVHDGLSVGELCAAALQHSDEPHDRPLGWTAGCDGIRTLDRG